MFELILVILGIAVVLLFLQTSRLNREIQALKQAFADTPKSPVKTQAKPMQAPADATIVRPSRISGPLPRPTASAPKSALSSPKVPPKHDDGPDYLVIAARWVAENWVLVVAGVSLILAAVFLVQYGIENGLLGPWARVMATAGLGLALFGAAEYVRRKQIASALPVVATLAGAGVVALYIAVFSAHALYGFIGPLMAFALLGGIAVLGVFSGWLYGPILSGLSVVGGMAVPFLLDSTAPPSPMIYMYPVLITVMGLCIDSLRGWVWVSILSLSAGLIAVALFALSGVSPFAAPLAFAAIGAVVPFCLYLSLRPTPAFAWPSSALQFSNLAQWVAKIDVDLRVFITLGANFGAVLCLILITADTGDAFAFAVIGCALIFVTYGLYLHRSDALAPVVWMAMVGVAAVLYVTTPPADIPPTFPARKIIDYPIFMILCACMAAVAISVWRMAASAVPMGWALATGMFASMTVYALAQNWAAADLLTPWGWALHVMGVAAVLVGATVLMVKRPSVGRENAAYLALAALGLMAYALFILLSGAALTVALAVALACAAALDRQFNLRPITIFTAGATALISYQLFLDPGHVYRSDTWNYLFVSSGTLVALACAFALFKGRRIYASELSLVALTVSGTIITAHGIGRILERMHIDDLQVYVFLIGVLPLLAAFFGQLYLHQRTQILAVLRLVLAIIFGVCAVVPVLLLLMFNPLASTGGISFDLDGVVGVIFINTSTISYLGLTTVLVAGSLTLPQSWRLLRAVLWAMAGVSGLIWGMIQIRLLFHDALGIPQSGFAQGELYIYTVVMLITSGGLLYQSIAAQSVVLRRIALALLGLTIAKVFLVDITELTGLLRVFAFLVLGLVLAGLAWLDGWLSKRHSAPL
ncbi:MAG: DUF2339 domain-containing protein [Pseudomonadota bacterium]